MKAIVAQHEHDPTPLVSQIGQMNVAGVDHPTASNASSTASSWVERSTDDTERRCRTLRRTAILHAAALDGWDPDANVTHLS